MENTETSIAHKPEVVMPTIQGAEPSQARKTEAVTPKVDGAEPPQARKTAEEPVTVPVIGRQPGTAVEQARKTEEEPETVPLKVGDNNNPVARKPEAKPEASTPKAAGGEPSVAPKPEVRLEVGTPKVEIPNNGVARKPEAVIPRADAGNAAVRKPEADLPKGESTAYPVALKSEAVMSRTEGTNNSQVRRPETNMPRVERDLVIPETPVPSSPGKPIRVRYKRDLPAYTRFIPQHEAARVHLIEEQCRSFCLSLFFRERNSVHSLGITSSVPGEGKSFVAAMIAQVLSVDSSRPVLLVECDWENTSNHDYFGIPLGPGLAEWLRGECAEADIRYQVSSTLTVIRAGDGREDAVRLIQYMLKCGLQNTLARNDENLIIDLPPVITSSYGVFAANMVDALALVVRAGVTPDTLVADACTYLSNLPVQGIILNQVDYRPGPYSATRKAL